MNYRCPNCNRETEYTASNPHRPFCCERCKLADLGDWFNEKNQIAGDESFIEPDQRTDRIKH